jgi:hypothetical protein
VSENRVLRRTVRPKREEVAGGWGRLHNEELHNLYVSPNVISVLKSRRMGLTVYVAYMSEMRNEYNILVGKRERRDYSEDQDVNGNIILERILGK